MYTRSPPQHQQRATAPALLLCVQASSAPAAEPIHTTPSKNTQGYQRLSGDKIHKHAHSHAPHHQLQQRAAAPPALYAQASSAPDAAAADAEHHLVVVEVLLLHEVLMMEEVVPGAVRLEPPNNEGQALGQ